MYHLVLHRFIQYMTIVKRIRTYILKVIRKQGSCMQLLITCCISSVVLCAESSVPNVPTVARNTKMARWPPKRGNEKALRVSSILYIDYDAALIIRTSNIHWSIKYPSWYRPLEHSVFRRVQIYLNRLLISRRWCHVHFAPRRCLYHH